MANSHEQGDAEKDSIYQTIIENSHELIVSYKVYI